MKRTGSALRRLAAALALAAFPAPAALPSPASNAAPNLLLISVDTLRADHCSAYGYSRDTTPHLRALASEGARFDVAYAPASSTGPTHASVFTGLHPIAHGVIKNGVPLAAHFETLAERLAARGYQTAGVVSSFVLSAQFGYGQGFSFYQDEFDVTTSSMQQDTWQGHQVGGAFDRRADATTRLAARWLWESRDSRRPFFLFVHYFDPHAPYQPPDRVLRRFVSGRDGDELSRVVRRYDAEIVYVDEEIGRLLEIVERQGLSDDTIVIVTSDHGEGLMQHAWMHHGLQLYEEQVRVPLVVRWPGHIAKGRVLAEPVVLVDLSPSVLELLGVPADAAAFSGRSLAPALLEGAPLDPKRPVFLFRRHYDPQILKRVRVEGERHGIRVGRWKLIGGGSEGEDELYDLATDPGERTDRRREAPEQARELAAQLEDWRRAHARETQAPAISPEDRRALEALGYAP